MNKIAKCSKERSGSGWRYAVIRKTKRIKDKIYHHYDIHEIYGNGAYTTDPVEANGCEELDGLRWSLAMMLADSFRGPVYEIKKGKLVARTKKVQS